MSRKTPLSDQHSIIYVRVSPEDKVRLRVLADLDFGGSMAALIRHMTQRYAAARPGVQAQAGPLIKVADELRASGGDLDED